MCRLLTEAMQATDTLTHYNAVFFCSHPRLLRLPAVKIINIIFRIYNCFFEIIINKIKIFCKFGLFDNRFLRHTAVKTHSILTDCLIAALLYTLYNGGYNFNYFFIGFAVSFFQIFNKFIFGFTVCFCNLHRYTSSHFRFACFFHIGKKRLYFIFSEFH